ncbi:MAG: hypothetical protein HQK50_09225, partial [Oligoflexia bacterium]|nr:hypothetical protein [Oligoflexia bacterium]
MKSMQSLKLLTLTILGCSILGQQAFARQINARNNPDAMRIEGETAYERSFAALPLSGQSENPGWSDDYYAVVHGGVCVQFKGKFDSSSEVQAAEETAEEFAARKARLDNIKSNLDAMVELTEKDISLMSKDNLEILPAPMILDIKNKNFKYPVTRAELQRTKSVRSKYDVLNAKRQEIFKKYQADAVAGDKAAMEQLLKDEKAIVADINKINWFGQCHGWAPVTVSEKEPNYCETEVLAAGKKLIVPLWSSDMKALMAHLAAHYRDNSAESGFCGSRCNTYYQEPADTKKLQDSAFVDINPASLHIILANKLGKLKKGLVLEVTADAPVWNQGTVSYEILHSSEKSAAEVDEMVKNGLIKDLEVAAGTVKQIYVENKTKYISEVRPHKEAMGNKQNFLH